MQCCNLGRHWTTNCMKVDVKRIKEGDYSNPRTPFAGAPTNIRASYVAELLAELERLAVGPDCVELTARIAAARLEAQRLAIDPASGLAVR